VDHFDSAEANRTPGPRFLLAAGAACLFLLLWSATAYRTVRQYQPPGKFDPSRQGYCDFHNGIYYPSRAWLDGVSPYGQRYVQTYPVDRAIPFFSPMVLWLHAPLAVLPLRTAEYAYFALMTAMLLGIAWGSVAMADRAGRLTPIDRWRWFAIAAALLVFSRAGHITLFNGYFTFLLVGAAMIAVHCAQTRPWLAGLALGLTSCKPTYAIPLALLLLARGQWRAMILGTLSGAIGAAIGLAWLLQHQSLDAFLEQIRQAQALHRADPLELPVNSWTRIDLLAVVAKWLQLAPDDLIHLSVMVAMLIPLAALLWSRRHHPASQGAASWGGTMVLLGSIVTLYHHAYDAMLIWPCVVGLWLGRDDQWPPMRVPFRWIVIALLLFPAMNYASTNMLLDRLSLGPTEHKLMTSINAVSLALGLSLVAWLGRPGSAYWNSVSRKL
jgi:hypothetical protein